MANKRGEALAKELDNPNVQTFLDLISAAEGTAENGYRTAFGGGLIPGLADHPRQSHSFKQTDGKTNRTTAAGRYQFLESTWDDVAKRLGLTDFGERSQDLGAIELLRRAGALEAVKSGDFATALKKSGGTWASLPSSPYPQPKRSAEWAEQFLAANSMERQADADEQRITSQVAGGGPTSDFPVQQVANAGQATPGFNLGMPTGGTPQTLGQPFPGGPTGDILQILGRPAAEQPMSWLAQVQDIQSPEAMELDGLEPWEEQLMLQALAGEGDAARNDAVSSFFGEPTTPSIQLPKQMERTINRLIASL